MLLAASSCGRANVRKRAKLKVPLSSRLSLPPCHVIDVYLTESAAGVYHEPRSPTMLVSVQSVDSGRAIATKTVIRNLIQRFGDRSDELARSRDALAVLSLQYRSENGLHRVIRANSSS
jgi:hypothetical protein